MLGQVLLGKYRVSRLLDQGGMCKIWLAQHLESKREVAIKVLQEQFLDQSKPREFFRREIHILSRFQHPNAVGYYDSSPNDRNGPVLVMEYLRGIDLGVLLHRDGRMTPERAGRLLIQLCDVLGAAHKAGIVHRDVKPGNLMILYPGTPQETLKLMDFGLAKMESMLYIGADDLADVTVPEASGTPEYIAPEQALGHDIDARGDLYSAGVVLYEMLTGRRPFEHSSAERCCAPTPMKRRPVSPSVAARTFRRPWNGWSKAAWPSNPNSGPTTRPSCRIAMNRPWAGGCPHRGAPARDSSISSSPPRNRPKPNP